MGKELKCLGDTRRMGAVSRTYFYKEKAIKEFIKRRLFGATMLLDKFNAGNLTSIDLREHRQRIKDESGDKLI